MNPLLNQPFLTELDSRARIKGSRDPLGIQPIWTRFGRHLVGNLTTVSNSVLDFKVLLLGRWFAEQLAEELGSESEIATFLKWEQLAAYVRGCQNGDWSFRGSERVKKTLSEGTRVILSDSIAFQILGNQKMYGLWGLYKMPARASGLLDDDSLRLAPHARKFVEEQYVPVLERHAGKGASRILGLLRKPKCSLDVGLGRLAILDSVRNVLSLAFSPQERSFYWESLSRGGPNDSTKGRQGLLADLIASSVLIASRNLTPALVSDLGRRARRKGEKGEDLAEGLSSIVTCESVLAPAALVFGHLLGFDGKSIRHAVARLEDSWGNGVRTFSVEAFRELAAEIELTAPGAGDRWSLIAEALSAGAYQRLIELIVEQNGSVASARGGAAWVEIRRGVLNVRFRDERVDIPDRRALPTLWSSPYFLDSLRSVVRALKEA